MVILLLRGDKVEFEQFRLYDTILCIDLKSFFASVECVERGKHPLEHRLVVADAVRGEKTIILATSPALKAYGVRGRSRLFEVPKDLTYEIAVPRMKLYVEYSLRIINIYLEYVSVDDLFVYSIDEAFLDLTSYLELYKKSGREIAAEILARIQSELGLYATAGVGQNMVMAKFAMDLDAKHADDFIAEWTYDSFKERLWPITDLSSVWGIGYRTAEKLKKIGITSIGQLAQTDVELLVKVFKQRGEELFLHAHCIDISKVQDKWKLMTRKGYGLGQTLYRDYFGEEIFVLYYELCQEVCRRLRKDGKAAKVVFISLGYSRGAMTKGIHLQKTLATETAKAQKLFAEIRHVIEERYQKGVAIRRIGLSVTKLVDYRAEQLSLFDESIGYVDELESTIDKINEKFGKNALLPGSSYEENATQRERNTLIGGHKA